MIGAVTDDFTGTASAGVLIAKSQVRTGLFFDADAVKNFTGLSSLGALFVSSNSRHLAPAEAYASVYATTRELNNRGVTCFSKKIDTTLRGGIGYEIDAMMDCLGHEIIAIVVTAMPQSRRICVGGYSLIDGVLLTETSAARDIKTPVSQCYVPALLEAQTRRRVGLITIDKVTAGADALFEEMMRSRAQGNNVLVIDAISLAHIEVIARACIKTRWNILAVDPGSLTMQLSYQRGLAGASVSSAVRDTYSTNGKVALCVVGSANPLTKTQMTRLCDSGANVMVPVSPCALIENGDSFAREVARVVSRVLALIHAPQPPEAIVIETALHHSIIALKEEDQKRDYPPGTCSTLINDGLANITASILENVGKTRIAGLMLTGGDTMEAVCRKIGVTCIQALDNIVAQVDVGKIMGRYDGLPVIVKGGFCGDEETGKEMIKRLFIEAESQTASPPPITGAF